jgi:hypothetical protein
MHISKHSYCLANGYKLNKNYTEVLYSLWDVLYLVLGIHILFDILCMNRRIAMQIALFILVFMEILNASIFY